MKLRTATVKVESRQSKLKAFMLAAFDTAPRSRGRIEFEE